MKLKMSKEHRLSSLRMSGIVISRRAIRNGRYFASGPSLKLTIDIDQTKSYSKLYYDGFSPKDNTIDYTTMSESKPCSKQIRTYQPTYQLNSRKRFNPEVVEKILRRIVNSELEEVEYSDKVVPDICLTLADNIKAAIKEENYDRYRIIVAVTIGQRRQQSVHIFHSFLWDHERDAFASHNFENCHIFANVVVYGVYFD